MLPTSTTFSPGDPLSAAKLNENKTDLGTLFKFAEGDNVSFTWGITGELATIVDNERTITYTLTWEDGTSIRRIVSITDATNTWTFAYDGADQVTGITKT